MAVDVNSEINLIALNAGTVISAFLLGLITVQVYHYAKSHYNDALVMKISVYTVWAIETVKVVCNWVYVSDILVINPGNIDGVSWALACVFICTGAIPCITQSLFAYRLGILSQRRYIPLLIWSGSAIRFGFLLTIAVLGINLGSTAKLVTKSFGYGLLMFDLSTGMIVDFINTAILSFYLFRVKLRHDGMKHILNLLVIRSVEAGLSSCILAVSLIVIVAINYRNHNLLGIQSMLLALYSHTYSISFLLSLNTRKVHRDKLSRDAEYHSAIWEAGASQVKRTQVTVSRTVDIAIDGSQARHTLKRPTTADSIAASDTELLSIEDQNPTPV